MLICASTDTGTCTARTKDSTSSVTLSSAGNATLRITWSTGYGQSVFTRDCAYTVIVATTSASTVPGSVSTLTPSTTSAPTGSTMAPVPVGTMPAGSTSTPAPAGLSAGATQGSLVPSSTPGPGPSPSRSSNGAGRAMAPWSMAAALLGAAVLSTLRPCSA